MKTSLREVIRRERWAANLAEWQQRFDAELAAMILAEEQMPFGWRAVLEKHAADAQKRVEQLLEVFT